MMRMFDKVLTPSQREEGQRRTKELQARFVKPKAQ